MGLVVDESLGNALVVGVLDVRERLSAQRVMTTVRTSQKDARVGDPTVGATGGWW